MQNFTLNKGLAHLIKWSQAKRQVWMWSEWLVTEHRSTIHDSPMGQIIVHSVMLGNLVVPERNIIYTPSPAHGELGFRNMGEEEVQQRITLRLVQTEDFACVCWVHEQPLATICWMCPYHRVDYRRIVFPPLLPSCQRVFHVPICSRNGEGLQKIMLRL